VGKSQTRESGKKKRTKGEEQTRISIGCLPGGEVFGVLIGKAEETEWKKILENGG